MAIKAPRNYAKAEGKLSSGRQPSGNVAKQLEVNAKIPPKFAPIMQEHCRLKIVYGGRGSGKSWSAARALLLMGQMYPLRILCCREFQSSIAESVYELLVQQIYLLGLQDFYMIEKNSIYGKAITYVDPEDGIEKEKQTVFIFSGIATNITKIKSMEGINIAIIEEAHAISKYSLDVLLPTIRSETYVPGGWGKRQAEVWAVLNPESPDDEIWKRWLAEPENNDDDVLTVKMNYYDNPWCPQVILKEAEKLKKRNPEEYNWIYEGFPLRHLEGVVYANELRQADREGRLTNVPHDSTAGVSVFFDLGMADMMVLWFVQKCGQEIHLIDYYENRSMPLGHYLKVISEKPYAVDKYFLPHDAKQRELGTGMSIEEQIRAKGKNVSIVQKLDLVDGINATREVFPSMWFDKAKCADGIKSLRNYHFTKAEGGGFNNTPKHDKWSHAADALRYVATSLRAITPKEKKARKYSKDQERFRFFGPTLSTGWMAT